jgi:hypothetical protein
VGLVLLAGQAFGQLYQYAYKNGNIEVADSSPPGADAREKRLKEEGIYRSNRGEAVYPLKTRMRSVPHPGTGKKEKGLQPRFRCDVHDRLLRILKKSRGVYSLARS